MSKEQDRLESLRAKISTIDDELIRMIGERRDMVLEVGRLKEKFGAFRWTAAIVVTAGVIVMQIGS